MYSIDTESNAVYYIIYLDGVEFCKINKVNDLDAVKHHFGIK